MSYRIEPVYASSKPGAKPTFWAIVDSKGVEVKREIYKESAQRTLKDMNKSKRHLIRV